MSAGTDAPHVGLAIRDNPTYARTTPGLTPGEIAALDELLAGLPERFAALAGCGSPDTLVHGPASGQLAVGWPIAGPAGLGDCGVGHPLLDVAPFVEQVEDDARRDRLIDAFLARRRHRRPDSDPAAALRLVQPISALRQPVV